MDIILTESEFGVLIKPSSIHGILWLQTHFESSHWSSICNNQVIIEEENAKLLAKDAKTAGIQVNFVPTCSNLKKLY